MKSAMQEAIEYLRELNLLSAAIILEDKFLIKEKQQLIKNYSYGYVAGKSDCETNKNTL